MTKFHEARQPILEAIRGGAPAGMAAAYGHVHRSTFQQWLKLGREGVEPFAAFVADVETALDQYGAALAITGTRQATEGDSRMTQFILERRFPADYGRRQTIEHGNADGQAFRVAATPLFDPDRLTDDELAQLEALLEKARPADALPVVEARVIRELPA